MSIRAWPETTRLRTGGVLPPQFDSSQRSSWEHVRNAYGTRRTRLGCILADSIGQGRCLCRDRFPGNVAMDTLESTNHPFIVRIWLEESAEEVRRATWRGHITHAPTGKRCYLDSLDDIATFIAPYLEGMEPFTLITY